MNQKEIAEAARTLDHLSMTAMWEENKRLRAALESIVRRWDDSEKTGSLAWLMCEDARAALGPDVIVDEKIFNQAHGLREEFPEGPTPCAGGPTAADANELLGKPRHYKDGPKDS